MRNLYMMVKRVFDIVISLIILFFTCPVLLAISIIIRIKFGKPILFIQERPGYNNNIFRMYKFRTMLDVKDQEGNLLSDELRLTSFGKLMRATSLDELPELFNVIKGEMSLVGPRPLLVEYLELYTPEQARRHETRPGITGWAQINGRNAISWEEKFKFDVWYIDNWSLWLDLKILFMTISKVFRREGISQPNHASMEKFKGYFDNGVGM